ncbi:MAG: prepilin-type N-terminal cleavage/methylation domain-containing protein [Alphaproteobacteria bacterium]|nr:prepilin-type N-terminal cleavage/methylation domain-containing protein [Alphaproteobacteria bacterium]
MRIPIPALSLSEEEGYKAPFTDHPSSSHPSSAFSLVELSIVLVILGLLTGGILAGQSLIRAAELRSVATEHQLIISSVHSFRSRYSQIPGDMANATAFWGEISADPATCKATAATGTSTCNGDRDGRISHTVISSNEIFRFWQHLANAGLIKGSYTGISSEAGNSGSWEASPADSYVSRIGGNNVLWWPYHFGSRTGSFNLFDGQYGNSLQLGTQASGSPYAAFATPAEMWGLDTKLDDGRPGIGNIVARGTFGACTDATVHADIQANYLLGNSGKTCALIVRNAF